MRTVILAFALVALAMPAMAAGKQPNPPCNLLIDDLRPECAAQKVASKASSIEQTLAKPFQDLANFIADDSDAAIALSTAVPGLQDGHGQQCWMATKSFGDVLKAHPVPVTLKAQTDLEALRLLSMAANSLCANPHCTQVFADLATGIQTLAPINASIPIPSLHDICAKIPQIAVVPPVAVPADTTATTHIPAETTTTTPAKPAQ